MLNGESSFLNAAKAETNNSMIYGYQPKYLKIDNQQLRIGGKMDFINKIKKVFKENQIEIKEFTKPKEKISYKCLTCGEEYSYASAVTLLSKITLCKNCYNPFTRWNKERLEKKKLERLFPESNLTFLEFNGYKKSGKIKCNKCGYIKCYNYLPNILNRTNENFCENCEIKNDTIYTNMIEKLKKDNATIILKQWNGTTNKSEFQCKNCGYLFLRGVDKNFNNTYCPKCNKSFNKFTISEANQQFKKFFPDYTIVQYRGQKGRSLIKHDCNFIFSASIGDFSKNRGCPKCKKKYSMFENKINNWLEKQDFVFERQKRFDDLKRYSFDFAIQINNKLILVEAQGRQHYQDINYFDDFEKQKKRDNIKRNYCLVNNIPLIEIPYWEEKNLENFLQLKFNDYLEKE